MVKLLLLTVATLIPLGMAGQNNSPVGAHATEWTLLADNVRTDAAWLPSDKSSGSSDELPMAGDDDICYRIRAYIFKRDDDHPPKLVGSTTCGPRQPRARNAVTPEAHFEQLK